MTDAKRALEEYRFSVDLFLELGATNFRLSTLSSFSCIGEIARYIREKQPEAYIITSFASQPDGFTRSGQLASHLIHQAEANPAVDAVGLNCVSGARHMISLVEQLGTVEKPLSVMPNAGYPTVLGGRTIYEGDPQYFAGQMERLHAMGVGILGGCCGTTPKHLAATGGGAGRQRTQGDPPWCSRSRKSPSRSGTGSGRRWSSPGKAHCGGAGSAGVRRCGKIHGGGPGASGPWGGYHHHCRLPHCPGENGRQHFGLQNPPGAGRGSAAPYDLPGSESQRHQGTAAGSQRRGRT